MDLTKTEWAYFAGIIDGEGSLTIGSYAQTAKGTPTFNSALGISNTEEALIDWVVARFGGAKMTYTRSQTPKNARRTVYRWQVTGHKLLAICQAVLPYSVIKKRQLEIMIEFQKSYSLREYKKGQRGPSLPDHVLDRRFKLICELRSLHNRRGPLPHK